MNNLTRLFLPTCIILLAGLTACAPTTITLSPETPSVEITTPSQTPRLATATEPPTATAKPTETLIPTPTESVSPEFWEALKAKRGGDWSKYIYWDERYHVCADWVFKYAVDGTTVHDVPIPGLEGVVADLAVRAYYYDINGNRQTILVAIVIRLSDGTLIYGSSPDHFDSRAEMEQDMKDYAGAYQIGELGALPSVRLQTAEDFIGWHTSEQLEPPGRQAYLQFAQANYAALDEFIKTGKPTLKIILPSSIGGSGGMNLFNEDNFLPPTPTP